MTDRKTELADQLAKLAPQQNRPERPDAFQPGIGAPGDDPGDDR